MLYGGPLIFGIFLICLGAMSNEIGKKETHDCRMQGGIAFADAFGRLDRCVHLDKR